VERECGTREQKEVRARRKRGGWGTGEEKRCEERGRERGEKEAIHGFFFTHQR
jgi:hypothetical protein